MVLGNLGILLQKNDIGTLVYIYTKISTIWSKTSNFEIPMKKTEEETLLANCLDQFLAITPKAQGIRGKVDKWKHVNLKSFFTAKDTINRAKGSQ
jgi:hypothetical protein